MTYAEGRAVNTQEFPVVECGTIGREELASGRWNLYQVFNENSKELEPVIFDKDNASQWAKVQKIVQAVHDLGVKIGPYDGPNGNSALYVEANVEQDGQGILPM